MDGRRHRLRSGHRVLVRPMGRDDARALGEAVEQLSSQARFRRFHTGIPRLSEHMTEALTDVDHHDHEALAAVPDEKGDRAARAEGAEPPIVGVARFVRDPEDPESAELAIAVADDWQRRGLGTLLLRNLAQRAREEGITRFTAEILAENGPTLDMVNRLGRVDLTQDGEMMTARMDAATWPETENSAAMLLRRLAETNAILVPKLIRTIFHTSADLTRTLIVPVTSMVGRSPERDCEGATEPERVTETD